MKILIIHDAGLHSGGAENRVRTILQYLKKNKLFQEVYFISKNKVDLPGIFTYQASEATIYSIALRIIKEHNIDILQIHNAFDFAVNSIKAAKELNKKVIFFAHDYWPICARRVLFFNNKPCSGPGFLKCAGCAGLLSYLKIQKNKKILSKCDVGISPGEFVKNLFEKNNFLKDKWQIIKPWIIMKDFSNVKLSPKANKNKNLKENFILFVGPLASFKGALNLIKAMKKVIRDFPDLKLYFIGGGQEKTNIHRKNTDLLISRLDIKDNVKFLGFKTHNELTTFYKQAKILVFPSIWPELFGQIWAEALFCKTPVIATNVGTITEYLADFGGLVEQNNSSLLSKKISYFLKNEKEVNKIARKGKEFVKKNFNFDKSIKQLMRVYKTLK